VRAGLVAVGAAAVTGAAALLAARLGPLLSPADVATVRVERTGLL
jgi:hypothetical protein